MGTFNTYGTTQKKYGGSNPVWLTVSQKERCGGTLGILPPVGTIVPAGSLVNINEAGGKATLIDTFEVLQDLSATDTALIIRPHHPMQFAYQTNNLMKAPKSVYDTGTAISAASYVWSDKILKVNITANALGVLKQGDILIRANKVGTGATIDQLPTGITENDVYIDKGITSATVASVYHGEIMEDRIQAIPACIKAALPMIKFTKGI